MSVSPPELAAWSFFRYCSLSYTTGLHELHLQFDVAEIYSTAEPCVILVAKTDFRTPARLVSASMLTSFLTAEA